MNSEIIRRNLRLAGACALALSIDATPTDSVATGNEFRLTDAATGEWRFMPQPR